MGAFALCPFVDLHCKCLADLRKPALQTDLELFSLQSCSTATTLFTGILRKERVYILFIHHFCLKLPSFWSLSSLTAHPCDHTLCCLREEGAGKHCCSLFWWYLFVTRDVTRHSRIMGCCFPGALQHITVGSRIRENSLRPVTPRHHSFPVFCAVGK